MKSFNDIKLVLFDLDGTLVDSVPDLAAAGDEMMRQLGLPERGVKAARQWVGNGIERFVKRALTNDMQAEPEALVYQKGLNIFTDYYAAHTCVDSKLYPGVIEGLQALRSRGFKIGCVTNKAEQFTLQLLDAIGLAEYFDPVVAGDTTARKKPDPMPLLYAADYHRLNPDQCLLVGDSQNDVSAARAAGFPVIAVPYGYNHGIDIAVAKPDAIIDSIESLSSMLK